MDAIHDIITATTPGQAKLLAVSLVALAVATTHRIINKTKTTH